MVRQWSCFVVYFISLLSLVDPGSFLKITFFVSYVPSYGRPRPCRVSCFRWVWFSFWSSRTMSWLVISSFRILTSVFPGHIWSIGFRICVWVLRLMVKWSWQSTFFTLTNISWLVVWCWWLGYVLFYSRASPGLDGTFCDILNFD